jgi:hypothetical protein
MRQVRPTFIIRQRLTTRTSWVEHSVCTGDLPATANRKYEVNIIDKIESAHHVATEQQIETLAQSHYTSQATGARADGTYLKAVIVAAQSKLGKRGRPPRPDAQMAVLTGVHDRFYAAVLRGVTTPDIAPDESVDRTERQRRNIERGRRSNFARTAMSVLSGYVERGGDLRGLDVATVTKGALREYGRQELSGDPTAARVVRAQEGLLRSIANRARGDPAAAKVAAERAIVALRTLLATITVPPDVGETTVIGRGHRRTRAGEPVMIHAP